MGFIYIVMNELPAASCGVSRIYPPRRIYSWPALDEQGDNDDVFEVEGFKFVVDNTLRGCLLSFEIRNVFCPTPSLSGIAGSEDGCLTPAFYNKKNGGTTRPSVTVK